MGNKKIIYIDVYIHLSSFSLLLLQQTPFFHVYNLSTKLLLWQVGMHKKACVDNNRGSRPTSKEGIKCSLEGIFIHSSCGVAEKNNKSVTDKQVLGARKIHVVENVRITGHALCAASNLF